MPSAHVAPALLSLWKERFEDVPLYCANEISVGKDVVEDLRDFSWRETTQDQKRIERYLKDECCRHSVLLHVGIGNSGLARNFCSSVSGTVGITIQENELHHALGLRIRNYFPLIMNKYSMEFASGFAAGLNFADWVWVASALGMIAEDVNGDVCTMRSLL